MTQPGIASTSLRVAPTPLRVAIVGSGPAAFYAAEHFFGQQHLAEIGRAHV